MLLCNSNQIRQADQEMIDGLGFPGLLLMEAAGTATAVEILEAFPDRGHFLVLAGPGNNGGDGLVVARFLARAGLEVRLVLSHSPDHFQGDSALNWKALAGSSVPWVIWGEERWEDWGPSLPSSTVLVDALLGTGAKGPLRSPIREMVAFFRKKGFSCVAVDLPSGLCADTGQVWDEPIPATFSVTFQLPKICHYVFPAAGFCGKIHVSDIGIWPSVLEKINVRRELVSGAWVHKRWNPRELNSHKGSHGHALICGGSANLAGASVLACLATLRTGAGLVTACIPGGARSAFFQHSAPEIMIYPQGKEEAGFLSGVDPEGFLQILKGKAAVAMGPGLGNNSETIAFLKMALPQIAAPLVLDADALNILAENPELWALLPEKTILTPHPGEMSRLCAASDIQEKRLEYAEKLAQEKGVIVVLKGAHSLVSFPDGQTFVCPTGNPGMATAGSGDILTGMIAGLLAQGHPPEIAAPMGAYLHGLAGDLASQSHPHALSASLILEQIGPAFLETDLT